ncbi:MAG: glycosyltransferase family 4 protein [bacterium]
MNIGFFTDSYTPQIHGVVTSINLFRDALIKQGHNVYVFAPADPEGKKLEEENVFRFASTKSIVVPNIPFTIPISFKNASAIPKLELDLIHSHTPATMGLLADYYCYTKNLPHVYTYHTYYPEYIKHYFLKGKVITPKMVAKYDKFYCNRTNHVIAPSAKLEKVLRSFGVEVPITVLPTGLELEKFADVDADNFRRKFKIDQKTKLLLYVGRVATEKNIEYLIKMFQTLVKNEPDSLLAIVGDGPGREGYEKLAKELGIADKVLFTGFIDREEVVQGFKAADLFLFASLTDTQGVVIFEAIASGTPVVMLKDEGLIDVVKEGVTGYTVDGYEEDMAKKVLEVLRDEKTHAKLSANCLAARPSLSIDFYAKKLEEVYKDTVAKHSEIPEKEKFWQKLNKDIDVPDIFRQNGKKIKNLFKKN